MSTIIKYVLVALIGWTTINESLEAQPFPLPFVHRELCPFEYGCDFHPWIIRSPVAAYLTEGDTSSLAFHFQSGDTVLFQYGDMFVEQPGILTFKQDYRQFKANDTIYILCYTSEGSYDIWYRDTVINYVQAFWQFRTFQGTYMGFLAQPKMTWWVKVSNKFREFYWLRLRNIEEYGIDFEEDIEMVQRGYELK